MDRSALRMGGVLVAALGVSAALGNFLHPPQPASLEAFAGMDQGVWNLAHVAIGVAGLLLVVSALFLARQFTDAAGEGWALVGAGSLILGGVGILAVGAIETSGFQALLGQVDSAGAGAEHAFLAATAGMGALATAAFLLMATGVLTFGVAMSRSEAWPAWAAWSGVAIGALGLVINVTGILLPDAVANVPFYLIAAWFVAAGSLLFMMGRPQPAPQAEIPAQEQASSGPGTGYGDY